MGHVARQGWLSQRVTRAIMHHFVKRDSIDHWQVSRALSKWAGIGTSDLFYRTKSALHQTVVTPAPGPFITKKFMRQR